MPYPGWVRRGREPSTPRRALSCLNDIATMSASYLALSWTSSLLTWHSLTNHVSLSLLELAVVHAASRLSGLQLHLVQAAWQAVLLHSSQHSELLGIDSLIMKCGICGSQIMVLILARDTTHWAVRVLSSSSVPAHLPINWLEGA